MMTQLYQEIHEQPRILQRLLDTQSAPIAQIATAIKAFNPTFVCIAARGTSDNAARYAQYLFGTHARLSVALATPSVHTLYETTPNLGRALVIAISQSGQSEDIRQVVHDARAQGALTISITNDPTSPLAQGAEHHIDLSAGIERSVAATKSYTAQLMAIAMLVGALVGDEAYARQLNALPQLMQETLESSAAVANWIDRYRYMERYAVIGRGYNYSTAFEISLKVKELNYIAGEGYSEADFRHGPIAIIQSGFTVVVVAPEGKVFPTLLDLLAKLHGKSAECLVITNRPNDCAPYAKYVLPIPTVAEHFSPILAVVPGQFIAMHLAMTRGNPVDQPRGLTKVTNTV